MLLGAALIGAVACAYWMYMGADGCLGRCGRGTRCVAHLCVDAPTIASGPLTPPKDRRRRGHPGASADSPAAPAEVELHPGDEKMLAQGDTLGRPERIDLSQPDTEHELSQDELDRTVHAADPAIFRCITDAVGSAPLDGKVEVGLRVEKSGQVTRVRVEAPALLQHHGLTHCVHGVVSALAFPRSGGASVVTYPFELK